ncbi:hypothetical protein LI221_10815 [Faecalimonas umbilicata]|nr:hypothetical protein [Faecalimonas umbilicata]
MIKKSYIKPEMEIVLLRTEDIMATSGEGGVEVVAPGSETPDQPGGGTWGPIED